MSGDEEKEQTLGACSLEARGGGRVTGGGYKRPPWGLASAGLWFPSPHGTFEEVTWRNSRRGPWGGQAAGWGQELSLPVGWDWQRPTSWSSATVPNACLQLIATKIWWYRKRVSLEVITNPLNIFLPPIQEKEDEKYCLRAPMQVEERKLNAGRWQWGEVSFHPTISTS